MANIVNSFFHRHPERLKKTQGFRKGIWGFFRRPSISVPAVVDRQWLDQQLGGLAALAREHGEEEVIGFLERLLTTTGVRKDSVLQARVLYALQVRLAATIPVDDVRLQECLQRMEALLAQHDGTTDVIWLKLRGAVTRKRTLQGKTEEEPRPAGTLFHANELLAGSLRNLNDPLTLSAAGKLALAPALVASGEAAFWIGGALLGKELVARRKRYLNPRSWCVRRCNSVETQ